MSNLRLCPFCDEEALLVESNPAEDLFYVECTACGARGPVGSRAHAVAAWNRRVFHGRSLCHSIVCLETGEMYGSVAEAARHVGRPQSNLTRAAQDLISVGGYHWAYADDPDLEDKLGKAKAGELVDRRCRPLVCLETGKKYPSSTVAGKATGTSGPNIRRAVTKDCAAGGYHWAYADDPDLEDKLGKWKGTHRAAPHTRPIVCLETGVKYPSAVAAAKSVGGCSENIRRAVRDNAKARGYHWAYADDPELEDKLSLWGIA